MMKDVSGIHSDLISEYLCRCIFQPFKIKACKACKFHTLSRIPLNFCNSRDRNIFSESNTEQKWILKGKVACCLIFTDKRKKHWLEKNLIQTIIFLVLPVTDVTIASSVVVYVIIIRVGFFLHYSQIHFTVSINFLHILGFICPLSFKCLWVHMLVDCSLGSLLVLNLELTCSWPLNPLILSQLNF